MGISNDSINSSIMETSSCVEALSQTSPSMQLSHHQQQQQPLSPTPVQPCSHLSKHSTPHLPSTFYTRSLHSHHSSTTRMPLLSHPVQSISTALDPNSGSNIRSGIQHRCMTSLITSGLPGPRPEVALEMSTIEGGHLMRTIRKAESVADLDAILHTNRAVLRPHHIGIAALTLEKLCKCVGLEVIQTIDLGSPPPVCDLFVGKARLVLRDSIIGISDLS